MDADNLRMFAKVAEYGSFSKAAASAELPVSTVSRRLSTLEDEIKMKLIERHPRGIQLTEAGQKLLPIAQDLERHMEQAELCLQQYNDVPTGRLRIAMPASIGNHVASDIIHYYKKACPDVDLELQLTDRRIDPVAEAFDLVFVYGPLPDSTMVAKKVYDAKAKLVATPQFMSKHSILQPQDLEKVPCVVNSVKELSVKWQLIKGGEIASVMPNAQIKINSSDVVLTAVESHFGVSLMAADMCHEKLKTGQLVEVLPQWQLPDWEIYVLFPSRNYLPTKTRTFLDMIDQIVSDLYGKS